MPSAIDKSKRALVALIRTLAVKYGVRVDVTRESADMAILKAYRTLSRKVHPDKGGSEEDQKQLNASHDLWQDALRDRGARGRLHLSTFCPLSSWCLELCPPSAPN